MEQFLNGLFLDVLNMSITASYVIFFVLVARLLFKKAPKIFSYSLWAVVLFRLVCPFSFSSSFSFLNAFCFETEKMEHIPQNIGLMAQPQVNVGINAINQALNQSLPVATPDSSVNPMQVIMFLISLLWLLGVFALIFYSVISYLVLKRKVCTSIRLKDNVLECEAVSTPFVLGIIKPKIYLPFGLSEAEKSYILKHEQTHIRRFDYLIKPFAFLILCIHWFNPLVWVSFMLMNKDMEMSCDERVLKELGIGVKRDYSSSLLSFAVGGKIINGSPIAFGESNIKNRIKNVLNYKHPAFWVVIVAVIVTFVIVIGLVSNPIQEQPPIMSNQEQPFKLLNSGTRTNIPSVNDVPNAENPLKIEDNGKDYYIYKKNGKYYCEKPYDFINEIDEKTYKKIQSFITSKSLDKTGIEFTSEIINLVENNLSTIMSSPKLSSNPNDYIKAHSEAYEQIIKYGGEDALNYMIYQFAQGKSDGLRGHIMMRLSKELLGQRNNVTDEYLSPEEWFQQLNIRQEIFIPDFSYTGNDPLQKLVYDTEVQRSKSNRGGFTIVAPYIFGSYEEDNKLKIFVTTVSSHYRLYDKVLSGQGGSAIPVAITYTKNSNGSYTLEKYQQAMDGSYFASSIKEYCIMPVSGKEIKGLADKILNHYGDYDDLTRLERQNLISHLKANKQYGVSLHQKNFKKPDELIPIT